MSGRILTRLSDREDVGRMTSEIVLPGCFTSRDSSDIQTSSGDVASSLILFTIFHYILNHCFVFLLFYLSSCNIKTG